jgi:hypothetical protein
MEIHTQSERAYLSADHEAAAGLVGTGDREDGPMRLGNDAALVRHALGRASQRVVRVGGEEVVGEDKGTAVEVVVGHDVTQADHCRAAGAHAAAGLQARGGVDLTQHPAWAKSHTQTKLKLFR